TAPEPTKPASAPAAAAPAVAKLSGPPIEFWSRDTGAGGAMQPLVKDHLADFEKATRVKASAQFMVFQESLLQEQAPIAAGTPPEVAQQGPGVAIGFAAADHLHPLDDALQQLGADNFVKLQVDAYVNWHGKTFGLPFWMMANPIVYHKDLLDKAG